MRPLLVAVLVVVALAGCLGSAAKPNQYRERTVTAVIDSGVVPGNRTGDQFYLVWVQGAENAKRIAGKGPVPGSACDVASTVEYDAGSGKLVYDSDAHAVDTRGLQILVALQYRADTVTAESYGDGCGDSYALVGSVGRAEFRRTLRPDLDIEVIAEPQNGFLTYNKAFFLPVGKKIHVNLTRVEEMAGGQRFYVTGDFEVVNLGLWTVDRLGTHGR